MAKVLERWDKSLQRVQKELDLSQEDMARILSISSRNFGRWLSGEVENPGEAHLQSLQEIEAIVDEARKALKPEFVAVWFRTPNSTVADLRPLDLLSSRSGQSRVRDLLGAIRWGIPV